MSMRARHLLVSLALLVPAVPAFADGTLTHLSGPVSVQTADGKTQSGKVGARVGTGDTVVTGSGAYVRMQMTDGGEMVMRPESQLKVESYKFNEQKPAEDNFVFRMLKGGLRTVTGLIGKRGNRDAYSLRTATATVGIRGTQFDLRVCAANCGALADGTYLAVRFGSIQTTNAQGTLTVPAGQVAFVPAGAPPAILPRDPGIGFTPPAVIPKLDEKKREKKPDADSSQGGQSQGAKPQNQGAPPQPGNQQSGNQQTADSGGPECSVE